MRSLLPKTQEKVPSSAANLKHPIARLDLAESRSMLPFPRQVVPWKSLEGLIPSRISHDRQGMVETIPARLAKVYRDLLHFAKIGSYVDTELATILLGKLGRGYRSFQHHIRRVR